MPVAYLLSDSGFEKGNTGLSGTRSYIVIGALTDADAYDCASAQVAADGATTYFLIPVGSVSGKHLGGGVYRVDIKYDPRARVEAGEHAGTSPEGKQAAGGADPAGQMGREWSLSTGGGTKRITRSRKTISTTLPAAIGNDPDAPKPDFRRLIGVSDNGVEGVDILAPDPQIRVSKKLTQLTLGYFLVLCEYTACTNNAAWNGVGEYELLFAGAEANYRAGDGWNVTYSFRHSKTEKNIDVGGGISVPVKLGWHYLWCSYERAVEDVGKIPILVPNAAMVEEVYEPVDFNQLDI